ncbi:MAG: hypothetical protein K8F91_23900 [Candidatus Obscuribacterales bacterium]|nr:hypothetical protein [Candidatus Obscuribacterales bacterium]
MDHDSAICPHATTITGRTRKNIGQLALVAIGNSLIEKDRAGLSFLSAAKGADICRIPLGVHTVMIADILKSHNCVVILDALHMEENLEDSAFGHMTIKLDKNVITKNSLKLEFSHGISFMDELRFYFDNESIIEQDLYFFGIASTLSDKQKRTAAMDELEALIESLTQEQKPTISKGAHHA